MVTRRAWVSAAGLAMVALATGCTSSPRRRLGELPGPGYEQRPADEALWFCGEDGVLRALDARTDAVSARVPLGLTLPKLTEPELFSDTVIWAYSFASGEIAVVDPATARVTGRARIPGRANRVGLVPVLAHGALWVAYPGSVWRVDATGHATHLPLPKGFTAALATATARHLWLAGDDTLLRLDPAGSAPLAVTLPEGQAERLAATPSTLYALGGNGSRLLALDPVSGLTRSAQDINEPAWALHVVGDSLWLTSDDRIHRVRENGIDTFTTATDGEFADSSAVLGDAMWLGFSDLNEVHRVDLATGRTTARVRVEVAEEEDPAFYVYGGRHTLWVIDGDFYNGISRVDPVAGIARKVVPTTGIDSLAVTAAPPPVPASPQ